MIDTSTLLPLALALVAVTMAVLLRNSLPFAWTARTTIPYLRIRIQGWVPRFTTTTKTAHANGTVAASTPSAQGCDPFDDTWTSRHRATLDDCDLLTARMSNSAYPKNLDVARAQFAVHRLADFVRDGGWMALASTSFTFHRPIGMLARYTITSRIETWDDKWLYMRNEYKGRVGRGDEATQVVYCTSMTKHCFKYGRKTITPWFVLAYCGYTGAGEATLRATNAARSRELRQSLRGRRSGGNPLQAFERTSDAVLRKVATWCTPEAWDVRGWEKQRIERMSAMKAMM